MRVRSMGNAQGRSVPQGCKPHDGERVRMFGAESASAGCATLHKMEMWNSTLVPTTRYRHTRLRV